MKSVLFESPVARLAYFPTETFLNVEVKGDGDFSLENTKDTFEEISKVKGEQKIYILLDARPVNYDYVPKETLSFLADNSYVKYQKKLAILINNTGLQLLANFYLKFFKPKTQTKVFKTRSSALTWLGINDQKTVIKNLESSLQYTN
jgi:hypothetical protein